MPKTIEKYLSNYFGSISNESIELIKSRSIFKTYKKGEIIINYGDYSESTFILKSGFVANFSLLDDGSHFIRTIFRANSEFGSLYCFISKKKSNIVFKALTDCEAYELKTTDLLFKKENVIITKLYVKILERTFLKFEKRISELAGFNATKRYLQLRKDIPNIDNILPQYQIANYINITAIQLSRIRKNLLSK